MREITYSQDLVIDDPNLLATLCVFCEKVWLPADLIKTRNLIFALKRTLQNNQKLAPFAAQISDAMSRRYHEDILSTWEDKYTILFREGILERLHIDAFDREKVKDVQVFERTFKQLYGDMTTPRFAASLGYHLVRVHVPGLQLFDAGHPKKVVDVAGSVFHLQLPKITASPESILELRHRAHTSNIAQFWEMIEEHARYAEAQGEASLVRAEKIRNDFKQWNKDRWKFRGKSLYVGLLTTLAWYTWSASGAGLATLAAADWIGEVNQRWAQRKEKEGRSFKFITRVDAKLKKLGR